jgi:hypothetical protein
MSLLRALKAKPDVYFLFGLLWLVAASAIELGYVGWYLDNWTEALATTSAMYLISLLYLARSYYRLMTETLAKSSSNRSIVRSYWSSSSMTISKRMCKNLACSAVARTKTASM